VPFAQAADVYWAPIIYGIAVTLLEGFFCLGASVLDPLEH
jgi:hypothetical protein